MNNQQFRCMSTPLEINISSIQGLEIIYPIFRCEKQKRCTLQKSNGISDNLCSDYKFKGMF